MPRICILLFICLVNVRVVSSCGYLCGLFGQVSGDKTGTVRQGAQGDHVRSLQIFLKSRGYDIGNTGPDGKFGQNTKNALLEYQRDLNFETKNLNTGREILREDGVLGRQTVAQVKKDVDEAQGKKMDSLTRSLVLPGTKKDEQSLAGTGLKIKGKFCVIAYHKREGRLDQSYVENGKKLRCETLLYVYDSVQKKHFPLLLRGRGYEYFTNANLSLEANIIKLPNKGRIDKTKDVPYWNEYSLCPLQAVVDSKGNVLSNANGEPINLATNFSAENVYCRITTDLKPEYEATKEVEYRIQARQV